MSDSFECFLLDKEEYLNPLNRCQNQDLQINQDSLSNLMIFPNGWSTTPFATQVREKAMKIF